MHYSPYTFDKYVRAMRPPAVARAVEKKSIRSLVDPARDLVLSMIDAAGIEDRDLAESCHVSAATLYAWRIGKVRRPRHMTMAFVLAALGKKFAIVDA